MPLTTEYRRCQRRQAVRLSPLARMRCKLRHCRRMASGPNALLAYASALIQIVGITFTIVLAGMGFDTTHLLIIKQIESYLIHLPLHNLTLYLSRRGLEPSHR